MGGAVEAFFPIGEHVVGGGFAFEHADAVEVGLDVVEMLPETFSDEVLLEVSSFDFEGEDAVLDGGIEADAEGVEGRVAGEVASFERGVGAFPAAFELDKAGAHGFHDLEGVGLRLAEVESVESFEGGAWGGHKDGRGVFRQGGDLGGGWRWRWGLACAEEDGQAECKTFHDLTEKESIR